MLHNAELDHVFLCAPSGRADLDPLVSFGLSVIEGNHPGQGSANACFLFENAYLELLWRQDDRELTSAVVQSIRLWERLCWKETGACPFGVAVRSKPGETTPIAARWEYPAPFLPPGRTIPILSPPGLPSEPIVFVSPVPGRLISTSGPELRFHCGRSRTLTRAHLWLRSGRVPSFVEALAPVGVTAETTAGDYHMELEWDGGAQGELKDFRPALPLSIRW